MRRSRRRKRSGTRCTQTSCASSKVLCLPRRFAHQAKCMRAGCTLHLVQKRPRHARSARKTRARSVHACSRAPVSLPTPLHHSGARGGVASAVRATGRARPPRTLPSRLRRCSKAAFRAKSTSRLLRDFSPWTSVPSSASAAEHSLGCYVPDTCLESHAFPARARSRVSSSGARTPRTSSPPRPPACRHRRLLWARPRSSHCRWLSRPPHPRPLYQAQVALLPPNLFHTHTHTHTHTLSATLTPLVGPDVYFAYASGGKFVFVNSGRVRAQPLRGAQARFSHGGACKRAGGSCARHGRPWPTYLRGRRRRCGPCGGLRRCGESPFTNKYSLIRLSPRAACRKTTTVATTVAAATTTGAATTSERVSVRKRRNGKHMCSAGCDRGQTHNHICDREI